MSKIHHKIFRNIRLKWQLIRSVETALLTAIITVPVILAAGLFNFQSLEKWALIGGFFLVLFFLLVYKKRIFNIQAKEISRYLNLHFAELENSVQIILEDDRSLSAVERIQKQRIEKRIPEVLTQVKISNKIVLHLALFGVAVLFLIYLPPEQRFQDATTNDNVINTDKASHEQMGGQMHPAEIKEASVIVYPPAYTNLPRQSGNELELDVPENAVVVWNISFSDSIKNAFLVFENGDSLELQKDVKYYSAETRLRKDGFYFIQWFDAQDTMQSHYYPIRIRMDQAPTIEIKTPAQYMDIPYNSSNTVELSVWAGDDFGLSAAHIVATVSRGAGEAVKFREQKLYFDNELSGNPKTSRLEKTIHLAALGMVPGDELYYHIVVADNRIPQVNVSRTDTYYITIPDTAQNEITIGAGLGVDQMPEYFRSQRQIIIDTEKIIEEAPKLAKKEYQEKLNRLGIDQKLLRLRYGQFLGEEFESGITSEMETLVEEAHEEHAHDHAEGAEDHHHHDEKKAGKDDVLLESYMHIHDYQGEATFFDDAIKAQLKAALSQMWEAELRLRTYRPQEALPFEYKALELIKDVQQKSRVYVERIGFEPPVLKPIESRLTGDLDEVSSHYLQKQMKEEALYPEMRTALAMVEGVLQKSSGSISYDKGVVDKAGQELAGLAVREPGRYLRPLASFRILAHENLSEPEKRKHLMIIREALHSALPAPKMTPYKKEETKNDLYRLFQLELSKQSSL